MLLFIIWLQFQRKDKSVNRPLLSLIPSSCMVVPNREIVNTNYFLTTSAMSNSVEAKCISENINIDKPRGRSTLISRNMSRVVSVHSDLLSIPYIEQIENQSNNSSWFNQTEQKNFQLSYISSKRGNPLNQDTAQGLSHSPTTYVKGDVLVNNVTNQQHSLGASSISYSNFKLANPKLLDGNLNLISIFGIIKKSAEDIITSLNYMASFIDKRDIKNNRKSNLSCLEGFGQVA